MPSDTIKWNHVDRSSHISVFDYKQKAVFIRNGFCFFLHPILLIVNFICLNLHSHDLRVHVGSLSRFKLSLPPCNVPGVLNCMSGRLSGCPGLY